MRGGGAANGESRWGSLRVRVQITECVGVDVDDEFCLNCDFQSPDV